MPEGLVRNPHGELRVFIGICLLPPLRLECKRPERNQDHCRNNKRDQKLLRSNGNCGNEPDASDLRNNRAGQMKSPPGFSPSAYVGPMA